MTIGTAEFDFVRALVRERSAIVLEPGKEYLVEARLAPLARTYGADGLSDLVAAARRGNSEINDQIVDALTTNETSFFRDPRVFDALRELVLPKLIAARARTRRLVVWCGAASSGQESYSVVMLMREHFPSLQSWGLRFVATDLSPTMISRAREGRYAQIEVNRGLPPGLLSRYFSREGTGWRISDDLRQAVDFREGNLTGPWPVGPPVDLVMLRNVLIYFDLDTKRRILDRARSVLAPDGYLILGASETTMGIHEGFERVAAGAGVYRIRAN